MGDIDIALRHVMQRHAPELAAPFLPPAADCRVEGWIDTQLTGRERRLDRALELRVQGERRLLHVEVQLRPRRTLGLRAYEYGALLALAHADRNAGEVVAVRSVVILLSGPKRLEPQTRSFRVGWPEQPFSGARYELEPVYRRTVADLRTRPPMWWVFAPLTCDADRGSLETVLRELRGRVHNSSDLSDLVTAMAVVADRVPRRKQLGKWIRDPSGVADGGEDRRSSAPAAGDPTPRVGEELIMASTIWKEAVERGRREGVEKGVEKGIEKGRREALQGSLLKLYQVRFGTVPRRLRTVIKRERDAGVLERWVELVATESRDQVDAELDRGRHDHS